MPLLCYLSGTCKYVLADKDQIKYTSFHGHDFPEMGRCTVLRQLNFVLLIFWYTLCPVGDCYLNFFSGFRRSCDKFRKIKE